MRFLRQRARVRRLVLYQQHFSMLGEKTPTIRAFWSIFGPFTSKDAINRWLPSSKVIGRHSSIPSKMIMPFGKLVCRLRQMNLPKGMIILLGIDEIGRAHV